MRECAKTGCDKPATKIPVLKAWAKGYPKKCHEPLRMQMDLPHCEDCAELAKPEDLVTDESWEVVVAAVKAQGKLAPDRKTIELEWAFYGHSAFRVPPPGGRN